MKKYDLLGLHLGKQAGDEWRASFAELEEVLGFPLPRLAHTSGAWWANEGLKPHNLTWLEAGWKVGEVDRKGQQVVFRRAPPAPKAEVVELGPAENVADAEAGGKAKLGAAALIGASVALVAGLGAVALRAVRRRRA